MKVSRRNSAVGERDDEHIMIVLGAHFLIIRTNGPVKYHIKFYKHRSNFIKWTALLFEGIFTVTVKRIAKQ